MHFNSQNFILFLKLAWRMIHANNTFGCYHSYVRSVARDAIGLSRKINDGSITERLYKKIQWYMVEGVVIGEMLARLTSHKISKRDKESLIYLGAIMALLDVIVDDFRLKRNVVNEILEQTFSKAGRIYSAGDRAVVKLYFLYVDKLKATIDDEQWEDIFNHLSIIRLQVNSDEQFMNSITEECVNKITAGKGGVSTLIFSTFLLQKNDSFRNAVLELGGFIQLMNDCQDIHKDTVDGIKTFVHFRNTFEEIADRLDASRKKCFAMIKYLGYPLKGRRETLFDLNAMFIVVLYKLNRYASICNYNLDFKHIAETDKKKFRINPFSPASVSVCLPKILRFDYESCESVSDLDF